ncbi:MAG: hypothetical protein COB26_05410 [Piscirickettsiaceae bacterium]|nr:MAG: hypothetical protein COB89_03395 [Piscirickettsiaceae bacterium]PCI69980.1 MAG: hypothetical protein COB26_05410 [Piscirickettsiaceae bacterium]
MNIGLPGAGVGGLYYLACAAFMPIKESFLTLTRPDHQFRYRLVITQLSIASGIILGLVLMYQLIKALFGLEQLLSAQLDSNNLVFYSLLPILISSALLLIILGLVELFAFFSKKRQPGVDS